MSYADWTFYSGTYGGTYILQAEFTRLMILASAYIDAITFDRAAAVEESETETITAIKFAACSVAEVLKKQEGGGDIKSEKVGNFSVTYADTKTAQLSIESKIEQAAKMFLSTTDLMYKGFAEDEYGGVPNED